MPNLLRTRDLNVQKKQEVNNNLKSVTASKHKSTIDYEKDGPSRPKRVALGDITEVSEVRLSFSATVIDSSKKQHKLTVSPKNEGNRCLSLVDQEMAGTYEVDPAPGFDFDKENANDPYAVSEFACDIFKYYKHREKAFTIEDYFGTQKTFERKERAAAVDWLVQIQESFELNHETMYMAVKLMDLYVAEVKPQNLNKSMLQLIPCVAVFIASKMEERSAPSIEDLIYLCKNMFNAEQLKKMEREMLRVVGFDLGIPLSYSFLRRYARVIKAPMPLLTTARYYLELSLHFFKFCSISESKMAAACMLLALRVTKSGEWNPILEKYSGYKLAEIEHLMLEINHMVRRFPVEHKNLKCVLEKYSHPIFFQVANQPLLADRIRGQVEH